MTEKERPPEHGHQADNQDARIKREQRDRRFIILFTLSLLAIATCGTFWPDTCPVTLERILGSDTGHYLYQEYGPMPNPIYDFFAKDTQSPKTPPPWTPAPPPPPTPFPEPSPDLPVYTPIPQPTIEVHKDAAGNTIININEDTRPIPTILTQTKEFSNYEGGPFTIICTNEESHTFNKIMEFDTAVVEDSFDISSCNPTQIVVPNN